MNRSYYSVKDVVAGEFGEVVFAKNDAVASRMFASIVKSHPAISPDDLELYFIGIFDDETGIFYCSNPRKVVIGDDTSDVDNLSDSKTGDN